MATEMRITVLRQQRFEVRRAGELAGRQFGAIARRQLQQAGASEEQIRGWLACGRLHPKYPGVYAYGRPDLSIEGELAAGLLYSGAGSAVGGLSALWWMGLLHRRPNLIHLDAPGRKTSRQDLLIHHPSRVERRLFRGLPVVPLGRALLTASDALAHNSVRLVLARAEFHKLLDLHTLQTTLTASPRGSVAVRKAMDAHLPQLARCVNDFEREFVLLCERFRLPIPDPNERVGRYRPDMLWREQRLIVELDGEDAHSTAAQLLADRERQDFLERLGFRVVRLTYWEVMNEPERVASEVRALLV